MMLRTCLMRSLPAFALFAMEFPLLRAAAGADELFELLAAQAGDQRRFLQRAQAGEGRTHHVVRVVRSEALREDVLDAGRLDHGADGAAGDDAGAVRGRLEQHAAGAEAAERR